MANTQRINWDVIEGDYVQGIQIESDEGELQHIYPSYDTLATKYNIHKTTIAVRSSRDEWIKKREIYQLKIKEARKENSLRAVMNDSAAIDYYNISILKNIQLLLTAYLTPYLAMLDRDTKELIDQDGNNVRLNVRELKDIVSTVEVIHKTSRQIYGEPINADDLRKELNALVENKSGNSDGQLENKIKTKIKELEKMENRSRLVKRKKEIEQQVRAEELAADNARDVTPTGEGAGDV